MVCCCRRDSTERTDYKGSQKAASAGVLVTHSPCCQLLPFGQAAFTGTAVTTALATALLTPSLMLAAVILLAYAETVLDTVGLHVELYLSTKTACRVIDRHSIIPQLSLTKIAISRSYTACQLLV